MDRKGKTNDRRVDQQHRRTQALDYRIPGGRECAGPEWDGLAGDQVVRLIRAVVEAGGLVSFSSTSDGGALRIWCSVGLETHKRYGHTVAQIEFALHDIEQTIVYNMSIA